MTIRILIHQSKIGALFGRGGENIKELRKKLDAAIKIFNMALPNSTDRVKIETINSNQGLLGNANCGVQRTNSNHHQIDT